MAVSTISTNTGNKWHLSVTENSLPSQVPRKGLRDPQRNHTGRLLLEENPGNGHERTPGGEGRGTPHTLTLTHAHSLHPTLPLKYFTSLPPYLHYFLIKQCAKLINGEMELTLTFDIWNISLPVGSQQLLMHEYIQITNTKNKKWQESQRWEQVWWDFQESSHIREGVWAGLWWMKRICGHENFNIPQNI